MENAKTTTNLLQIVYNECDWYHVNNIINKYLNSFCGVVLKFDTSIYKNKICSILAI